jgi:glycine C-acetyltransferase
VADGSHVINFCANNYLGLANHPDLIAAAKAGMDSHGFGMASVRFICGTQDSHKELEQKLAAFLGMEDAILYSSCFDANGGLFETWYKMAALIQSGLDLSPIITHRFSIDDFQKGFDAMCSGQSGKVILSWD